MSGEAETQRLLGQLLESSKTTSERLEKMEKKLDSVVAMTNRWKGATTILIIIGGFIGWASNLLFKGHA
jgi:dsDNA-specific endonuclease/ATPase MutS2